MLFLTAFGVNTYVVMLQQLHNWHIDWDFMDTSLPWANVVCVHIAHALWYCQTHAHPMSSFMMNVFRHGDVLGRPPHAVPDHSWATPEPAPRASCGCLGSYCAVRHMQLLHHGRVPYALDTLSITPWLLRLHTAAARRLDRPATRALLARLHDPDLVKHVLRFWNRMLVDDMWRRSYPIEHQ